VPQVPNYATAYGVGLPTQTGPVWRASLPLVRLH